MTFGFNQPAETFGNPMLDGEANRELFEEQVEIILKALHSSASLLGVLPAAGSYGKLFVYEYG